MAKSKLIGAEAMARKLVKTASIFGDNVARALSILGEDIMLISKRDFAPVDTGNMRSTGHVVPARREQGRRVVVALVYGGTAALYTIKQHEDLELNHTVGEAKFLEKPLMARVPTAGRELAQLISLEKAAAGA